MTEEIFQKAEMLRNQINYYKKSIQDLEYHINSDFTRIKFCNCNVQINDVEFSEDTSFINSAMKIAIVEFNEKLSSLEKELKEL